MQAGHRVRACWRRQPYIHTSHAWLVLAIKYSSKRHIVPPVQALWRNYGGTMAECRMAEQFRFRRGVVQVIC
jgi:hypothetical protein